MFEIIRARYEKGYITSSQLDRYVALGVITSEQADEIRGEGGSTPPAGDTVPKAELDAAYTEGVNAYV